jgi:hypothetical protein
MARNEEGEVVFCKGCDTAGNYIGPVNVESDWKTQRQTSMGRTAVGITVTDKYGARSNPSVVKFDASVTQETVTNAMDSEVNPTILLGRIEGCNAGEVRQVACPAMGSCALREMVLGKVKSRISTLDYRVLISYTFK